MKRWLLIIIGIGTLHGSAELFPPHEATKKERVDLFTLIGNEYITSAELEEKDQSSEPKSFSFIAHPLSVGQQKFLLFNKILSAPLPTNSIIEKTTWDDLELFRYSNVLKTIQRTRTIVAHAMLGRMLIEPLTDTARIHTRQRCIKDLCENRHLFTTVDRLLYEIGQAEPLLYRFWRDEELEQDQTLINLITSRLFSKSTNDTLHETLVRLNQTGNLFTLASTTLTAGTCVFLLLNPESRIRAQQLYDQLNRSQNQPHQDGILTKPFFLGFYALMAPYSIYQIVRHIQTVFFQAPRYLHTKFVALAQAINAMTSLHRILKKQSLWHQEILGFDAVDELLFQAHEQTSELAQLIALLKTDTFKGPPSALYRTGRLVAAYNLFLKVRDTIPELLKMAGSLDAYLSMAKLYQEHNTSSTKFCFATLIEQAKPCLELHEFWNPQVPAYKVVTNTLMLGNRFNCSTTSKFSRSMILTGQNTAGKSTIIKGVALCALLAQTFGIAPAYHAGLTPFSFIGTHINVTDDIKEGRSLFQNEVFLAKQMLDKIVRINEFQPKQFSLVIIDEMFRGTGPTHAELLSYGYARKLARIPTALVIESTHHPKLINLEQETNGIYQNYKIEIYQQQDGSLVRPYKIEPGYSLTNIAQEILQEQGLYIEDTDTNPFINE